MAVIRRVLSAALATFLAVSTGAVAVAPSAAAEEVAASKFVSVAPTRVMDTRTGVGAPKARPAPLAVVTLQVAGVGGVPDAGATAVVLNLTITEAVTVGYVQAFPAGLATLGASSNMNVDYPGQTVAALVTVPIGADGHVSFYDVPGGHLIADVFGYYSAVPVSTDGRYRSVAPTRILDSRNRTGMPPIQPPPAPPGPVNPGDSVNCGDFSTWDQANAWFWTYYPSFGDVAKLDFDNDLIPCETISGARNSPYQPPGPPAPPAPDLFPKPSAGSSIDLQVTGVAAVPQSGVSSVVLNVTATDSDGAGYVQVVPTGGSTGIGASSNLNLNGAGETTANQVIVPVGSGGRVRLSVSNRVDVIADVAGFFTDASETAGTDGLFVPLQPARVMDTRATGKPAAGSTTSLAVSGSGGVPATGVGAVVVNATVVEPAGAGYLQLFPAGRSAPGSSSNVNYLANRTVANSAITGLGDAKLISIYTGVSTHVVVDVFGYLTAPN